jgi:FkbM family methyltransferase
MRSQNNEEKLILDYFNGYIGTFLEIGANDGQTLSNCHEVALQGWGGVCVEPSIQVFPKLKKLYAKNKKIQCLQLAIGNEDKTVKFYESGNLLSGSDAALVSSVDFEETKRWRRNVSFVTTEAQMVTFETFMQKSKYNKFDLISIDAEGFDFAILSQIDLTQIGCKMLVVEWNGKDKSLYQMYCEGFGMRLHAENAENLIFIR